MQKIMNKVFWAAALLGTFLCFPLNGFAHTDEEEPIIVLKTSIYETYGEANSFQILLSGIEEDYVDVDCGFGPVEHELLPAGFDSESGSLTGTLITCNVSKEGIVKIYGKAENIDVLNASGCYLKEAHFDGLSNLVMLDLSHNELGALDLTSFTKLQSIELSDNPFDVKPLVIGAGKPMLQLLDIGRIDYMDASFNLSDYPALVTFDAWGNKGLYNVDPTGCPDLQKISIDATPVKTLDVSKNEKLTILNISDTGISSIDVSHNPFLQQFYCDHMSGTLNTGVKISSLDLTNNPRLVYLYASGNNLTEIDLSQNTLLQMLFLNNNKLSSINLDNNYNLVEVQLANNNFTFATLPLPGEWSNYVYTQQPMGVAKTQKEGAVLDFSDKVLREGTVTTAALYRTSETNPGVITALGSDYYTYKDGKITLLKAVTDSVYVAFANSAFPNSALTQRPLCTTKFKVKTEEQYGQDDLAFSFVGIAQSGGTPMSFGVGMDGATADSPKTFYVDFGDGKKVECKATSSVAPVSPNVDGNSATARVKVYVPEGELITAIDIEGIALSSIDLSALAPLASLRLVDTELYSIDLGWNKSLSYLELTGNHFSSLNIRGVNDAYQKNLLHNINLSNNELKEVTLNDNFTLYSLNLSNNQLTELSFKDADNLRNLNLSGNKLTQIDLNYCTIIETVDISNNKISSITLPAEHNLSAFNCANNAMTFVTLPQLSGVEGFVYAPQQDIAIPTIGPSANLSAQNMPESATVYAWRKTDGTMLQRGTDYKEEGGKTSFLAPAIGSKVYCEMTNPAFADLTLKSTVLEVAEAPTNTFATFTTTQNQNGELVLVAASPNTSIFIDWNGNGQDLEQYTVGTSPTNYPVAACKDAKVKVYSYGEQSGLTVFSIKGVAMADMDASKLEQLTSFSVIGAGLSEISLPQSRNLMEIFLSENNFAGIDLTAYPSLQHVGLSYNKLESFDASLYPGLNTLSLAGNGLSSIKLDNKNLWNLELSSNELEEIDLTGVPNMEQLFLYGNKLAHVDVSMLNRLRVLSLDSNKFKFSTLPLNNNYMLYTYANQEPIEVDASTGVVDLSSEAVVNGTNTVYRWFVGLPSYDDYGELVGDELVEGEDFVLENGVTRFAKLVNNVMCVMTNELFPRMVLYTPFIDVEATGIGQLTAGTGASVSVAAGEVTVHAASGTPVRLYDASGRLVAAATVSGGSATFSGLSAGVYVVKAGKEDFKVALK